VQQFTYKHTHKEPQYRREARNQKWDLQESGEHPMGMADMASNLVNVSRHLTRGHRRTNPAERQAVAGISGKDAFSSRHFGAILQQRLLAQLELPDDHPAERQTVEKAPFLPSGDTLQASMMVLVFLSCFFLLFPLVFSFLVSG